MPRARNKFAGGQSPTEMSTARAEEHALHLSAVRHLNAARSPAYRPSLARAREASTKDRKLTAMHTDARRSQNQERERVHHPRKIEDPAGG